MLWLGVSVGMMMIFLDTTLSEQDGRNGQFFFRYYYEKSPTHARSQVHWNMQPLDSIPNFSS